VSRNCTRGAWLLLGLAAAVTDAQAQAVGETPLGSAVEIPLGFFLSFFRLI